MNRPSNRRSQPSGLSPEAGLVLVLVGVLLVAYVIMLVALSISGVEGETIPMDPIGLFVALFQGDVTWTTRVTITAVAIVAAVVVLVILVTMLRRRSGGRKSRVDSAAIYLGRGDDISSMSKQNVESVAKRLGVQGGSPGVPIGQAMNGKPLYGSWEDMHIDIWGPRTGKTTSRAIPAILEAPGACLVTSNKRDIVDATRDVRAARGQVFVFDPQGIADEPQQMWWNPLTYVTDEVRAAEMAEHFAAGSRDADAKTDAYFDGAAKDLLAGLLLAAALDRRPITDVYRWLTRPNDDDPVRILEAADFRLTADQVAGVISAPHEQRGGVFGTAQQMAACLTNRRIASWITPNNVTARLPEFSPEQFVRQGGTLYNLSKEGRGTAGPLTTALTVAVAESGERFASQSPGGRMPVPMLAVLDEAANVCRWSDLPSLYSHYGSRGIVLMTILQSWSQGVDVWGESGMKKLWSASNIAVYGGGVREEGFLEMLSKLLGDYDKRTTSVNHQRREQNVSRQLQRERILDVSELAAMPKGRAVVFASGARPTMIRTTPWMAGPHADAVRSSIANHDPQAQHTINSAQHEQQQVQANLAQLDRGAVG